MTTDLHHPSIVASSDDPALELLVDDGEVTLVPADLDGPERMTTWLTVSQEDVVELADWR